MPKIYKSCLECSKNGVEELEKEPKMVTFGTDGFGQPVRFSECECGSLYGWFNVGFYEDKDTKIDTSFLGYLDHRISHYNDGVQKAYRKSKNKQ